MALSNIYPLKFGVLYVVAKENRDMSLDEIYDLLTPAFGGEKAFTKKGVRFHLDSMVGIGMIEMINEYFKDDGQLEASFLITPFGIKRTELLPYEYRAEIKTT